MKNGVRLPRTEQRFNGVMSKVLRNNLGKEERKLFELRENQTITDLVESLHPSRTICLTVEGILKKLRELFRHLEEKEGSHFVWLVGGFPRGHFSEQTKSLADDIFSISNFSLPAHVVTSRISYEIEETILGSKSSF